MVVSIQHKYQQKTEIHEEMTIEKVTLIEKDLPQRNATTNYISITCLLMKWKIQTAQVREKFYNSLISQGIFPDEQIGCRKRTRDKDEQLYIDQHILNEIEMRRKDLTMAWID